MSLRRSSRTKGSGIQATPSLPTAESSVIDSSLGGAEKLEAKIKNAKKKQALAPAVPIPPEFAMPPPATPQWKRKREQAPITPQNMPPLTPTPSAVGLMAAPAGSDAIDGGSPSSQKKKRKVRPVRPNMTNAPLQTPKGSTINVSPGKLPIRLGGEEVTTENLLERACDHLVTMDPVLQKVIDAHPCPMFSPEGLAEVIDPFSNLCRGILAQQVSGAAAKAIKNRFVALFTEGSLDENPIDFPSPSQVVEMDITTMRTAGLSQRKAEYIKGLAEKFVSGELTAEMLAQASDEEVLEKLIAVRGLGRWSVEMFATFGLKRMDIFSTGDLGVQRGMAAYMGRDVAKLKGKGGKWKYMSEPEMLDISAKFAPYRSLFMWYMWRIEDVDVDVMGAN